MPRDTFRIAIRKFGPFESAIRKQWTSFCAATGCALRLEAEAFDLRPLHETCFARRGLAHGDWDAAFVVTDWVAEAHATGALLDLAPRLAKNPPDDFPDGWSDSLLRYQQIGGQILGLPYHDGPECLVYRRDLLAQEGLSVPATWDEFHAAAVRLTRPAEKRWGTAFAAYPDGHNTVYDFCLQVWTRGGEIMDRNGRLLLDSAPARDGLGFYRRILNDPRAVHPDCRALDSVRSGFAFARGEVAMMVNWFGYAAMGETLAESVARGKIAIAPLPAAPGCASASLNVFWLLSVGRGSPHADTAYGFLRHCASAAQDKLLTLEGAIGCRRSTWRDPEVNRAIPFYGALERLHANARELPRLERWGELAAAIDRLVTQAISTDRPIASLCREAQREADRGSG